MSNRILRETVALEQFINNDYDKKDFKKYLSIYIRYLVNTEDIENVYSILDKYLQENLDGYNRNLEMDHLKRLIKNIYNNNNYRNLIDVEEIAITHNEWNIINSIEDNQISRLLFVMLVNAKIQQKFNRNSSRGWFSITHTQLFKESTLKNSEDNLFLINYLIKNNFIKVNRTIKVDSKKENTKTIDIQVLFIEDNTEDIKFKINVEHLDYKNTITYFNEYRKKWSYSSCKYCNNRFKLSKKNTKGRKEVYCAKCKKIRNKRDN